MRLSCPASGNKGRDRLLEASDFEDDRGINRVGSDDDMVRACVLLRKWKQNGRIIFESLRERDWGLSPK
jgi:hypothetical protein